MRYTNPILVAAMIAVFTSVSFSQRTYDSIEKLKVVEEGETSSLLSKPGCPNIPVVLLDDQVYATVQIGDQCWFRENLNVGKMLNGKTRQWDNKVIEKYCYEDKEEYCQTFGGLYRWNEALQYELKEGAQGICPAGWHVPTLNDFIILKETVDANGNSLKQYGQGEYHGEGTNLSGFAALLGGFGTKTGHFGRLGIDAYFWTSSEETPQASLFMGLNYQSSDFNLSFYNTNYAFSVRCIKN